MKNTVVPLKVPWMASPSVSGPSLQCGPPDERRSTVVSVPASFKPGTPLAAEHGINVVVELVLKDCQYAIFYPSYSKVDEERVDGYSWDAVPEQEWGATEECPDPGVYEVCQSEIVAGLGLEGFVHCLIPGDEYSVEFVARSWAWRVAATLEVRM